MTYSQHASLRTVKNDSLKGLKKGIWIYFILLIFEGAFRKWFLPSLATPLLIVRDPVAIWLLYEAWRQNLIPSTPYLNGVIGVGLFGILTAVLLGHGNLFVALFGARILLFHFPLIFIIGRVFDRDDVVKIGRAMLWIAIPMTVLIALQFYSPQSALVNRGVGGDVEGAGFSGAMGYFRPPGTFSFTNGTTLFYGFAASFIIYFWLYPKYINRLVLIAATAGLLAAIPLSISRGLAFQVGISVIFAFTTALNNPKYLGKIVLAGIVITMALGLLSYSSYFQTASQAFLNRFTTANKVEGGVEGVLIDRYLGGLVGALKASTDQPFFGYGIGMGTNVGSLLLTGARSFLISEGEWGRLVGELGPIMGLIVIYLRVAFSIKLGFACFQRLRTGDLLPWMLLSFGLLIIPQGGWAQPTALGFCVFTGGIILASFRFPKRKGRNIPTY